MWSASHGSALTLSDYLTIPLVGAPMAGATSAAMVAAICDAGGLGSLPLGWLEPDRIAPAIADVRALTNRPFACNLFIDSASPFDAARVAHAREALVPFREELGIAQPSGEPRNERVSFARQMEALFACEPTVLSFTFGIPPPDAIAHAGARGIMTIGTAKTVEEARSRIGRSERRLRARVRSGRSSRSVFGTRRRRG